MATAETHMGLGTNVANDGPPDLPTEERTTDVEAFRRRMDARREEAALHRSREAAAARAAGLGRGDRTTALPVGPPLVAVPKPAPPRAWGQRVNVDQAKRLAMVTAYLDGDSTVVLARRYGCSPGTVSKYLRQAGVQARPKGYHPPAAAAAPDPVPSAPPAGPSAPAPLSTPTPTAPDQPEPEGEPVRERPAAVVSGRLVDDVERAKIVAAYRAGSTAVQIAEVHGRNPPTIRNALRKAGIPLRDDRATRSGGRNRKVDDPAIVETVRALYIEQGYTQAELAEHLGVSTKAVQGVMIRNAIPSRPDATGRVPEPKAPAARAPRYLAAVPEPAAALTGPSQTPPAGGDQPDAPSGSPAETTADNGTPGAVPAPGPLPEALWLAAANPAIGAGLIDLAVLAAAAGERDPWAVPADPVGPAPAPGPEALREALRVPVDEVVRSLHDVVDATERLLDAQQAVAAMRLRRIRSLVDELLAVLDHTTTTGA